MKKNNSVSAREEFEMIRSFEYDRKGGVRQLHPHKINNNLEAAWGWIEKNFTHNSEIERIKLEEEIKWLEELMELCENRAATSSREEANGIWKVESWASQILGRRKKLINNLKNN